MKEVAGRLDAAGLKIAIVVSRFNDVITDRLLKGAVEFLSRSGAAEEDLTIVRVPGSFEIPATADRLAGSGRFQAVICLGTLIRGETDHYELIASQVAGGIAQVALDHGLPVAFGIITADTAEQAWDRAGMKLGNKGQEAAMSAVEMARLFQQLPSNHE